MTVLQAISDRMVSEGFTAGEIFQHHADQYETDHVLLTQGAIRERTLDGLENYRRDIVRVTIRVNDPGEIIDLLNKRQQVIDAIVGVHLTDQLVLVEFVNDVSPTRLNSKQWGWVGTFRVTACF